MSISPDQGQAIEIGIAPSQCELRLTLSIRDQDLLWDEASRRLCVAGYSDDEIEECIGPRADMSLADCLSTLILPLTIAGCAITDLAVRPSVPDLGAILLAAARAGGQPPLP